MIFLRLFSGWILQVVPFALLCYQPFAEQLRFSKRTTIAVTVSLILSLAAAFALAGCILNHVLSQNTQLFTVVNIIFIVTLTPCFLWYLYAVNNPWPKKLFVFSYALTGAFMITSVYNTILTKLYLGRSDGLPYRGYASLVLFLLNMIFLPVLILILRRHGQISKESFTNKESIYLSILSIVLLTVLFSGLVYNGFSNLYHPMTLFLYTALLIAVFIIYWIFFNMLDISHEKLEAQRKYDEVQRQLLLREEQYRRINDKMETTRRMRHDLRHHLITLQGFLKNEKTEQARQYLEHYLLTAKNYEIPKLCSNVIVNTVVGYYQTLAEEHGIRFSVRVAIPTDLAIQDIDLSVLIGNLLENAVDAVLLVNDDVRFIRFNMICSGKMVAITVDNSFDGNVKMNGERYLSTKKQHNGFGLLSVEAIAEKYSGGVEFTHDNTSFHSSVMLGIQLPIVQEP